MKAMILAAGRGERLRPLTDRVPKPLVPAGGKPLVAWHLERLAAVGFRDVVMNVSHLRESIERTLGDGGAWGLRIAYSREAVPLETAGGLATARALLGEAPFLLVNADVWCDADLGAFARRPLGELLARLLLVPNPPFRPKGDFSLRDGLAGDAASPRYTYAGIALALPALVDSVNAGERAPLAPLLRAAAAVGRLGGELHEGRWSDVGTLGRLAELETMLQRRNTA